MTLKESKRKYDDEEDRVSTAMSKQRQPFDDYNDDDSDDGRDDIGGGGLFRGGICSATLL
jgi:hypothetical protein